MCAASEMPTRTKIRPTLTFNTILVGLEITDQSQSREDEAEARGKVRIIIRVIGSALIQFVAYMFFVADALHDVAAAGSIRLSSITSSAVIFHVSSTASKAISLPEIQPCRIQPAGYPYGANPAGAS